MRPLECESLPDWGCCLALTVPGVTPPAAALPLQHQHLARLPQMEAEALQRGFVDSARSAKLGLAGDSTGSLLSFRRSQQRLPPFELPIPPDTCNGRHGHKPACTHDRLECTLQGTLRMTTQILGTCGWHSVRLMVWPQKLLALQALCDDGDL